MDSFRVRLYMNHRWLEVLRLLRSRRLEFSRQELERAGITAHEMGDMTTSPQGGTCRLLEGGRMLMAQLAISRGASISSIVPLLDWREFEEFTAHALEALDYHVVKDLRFKSGSGRRQLDVAAYKGRRILAVDCKKWKRYGAIAAAARHHADRVKEARGTLLTLVGRSEVRTVAFPVIVCLSSKDPFRDGCYLVDITKLRSFAELLEGGLFDDNGVQLS